MNAKEFQEVWEYSSTYFYLYKIWDIYAAKIKKNLWIISFIYLLTLTITNKSWWYIELPNHFTDSSRHNFYQRRQWMLKWNNRSDLVSNKKILLKKHINAL